MRLLFVMKSKVVYFGVLLAYLRFLKEINCRKQPRALLAAEDARSGNIVRTPWRARCADVYSDHGGSRVYIFRFTNVYFCFWTVHDCIQTGSPMYIAFFRTPRLKCKWKYPLVWIFFKFVNKLELFSKCLPIRFMFLFYVFIYRYLHR